MTPPHLFDNPDDYYNSLLSPLQREVQEILEDDPASYMDSEGIMQDFFNTYFEDIFEYSFDKGFVEEYLEKYVEKQIQIRAEP